MDKKTCVSSAFLQQKNVFVGRFLSFMLILSSNVTNDRIMQATQNLSCWFFLLYFIPFNYVWKDFYFISFVSKMKVFSNWKSYWFKLLNKLCCNMSRWKFPCTDNIHFPYFAFFHLVKLSYLYSMTVWKATLLLNEAISSTEFNPFQHFSYNAKSIAVMEKYYFSNRGQLRG